MTKLRKKLISPENPEIEYFDLLDSITANLVGDEDMLWVHEGMHPIERRKYLWIRHDIDWDLDKAVTMARLEAEYGYHATYFFLHTTEYWGGPMFEPVVKEIVSLGHGVGLHNNAVTEWVRFKKVPEPLDIFVEAKERLRQIVGRPILATSSHGDKLCHEKGFMNYDMWMTQVSGNIATPTNFHNEFPRYSLKSMGMFEAYFVRRDAYLSDSGHKWRGAIKKEIPTFEQFDKVAGARDTIARFNALPEGVMQLLVHPCWWEVG